MTTLERIYLDLKGVTAPSLLDVVVLPLEPSSRTATARLGKARTIGE